ncbi:SGNH/GDSL hydrolase family protein [Defluviitalea saccharophila]|uniref:SGNH/GDSL hydrolase family protein n=1 Tax=Defluviitalea saccharophila TaxID=879970 RepID=A0ABZ2Y452_9FIRM|nr:SGNH/GDSL hydrolase family protein [Candidatus Epulonipiscium sp.]
MKKHLKNIISVVLICILATSQFVFAANNKPSKNFISQVIAFGDSHSDSGEAKRITTAIVNDANTPEGAYIKPSDELYWESRYSNGPTSVEILAEKLGVHLFNYATGGATSGEGNYSAWMDHLGPTGLLGQIQAFEKSLNGQKADPNALYFIFASANDYYLFMDYELEGTIKGVADQAVVNINTAVKNLADLGAKKFFVVNSSDLSLVPYEITTGRTAEAKAFTEHFNKELPKTLKKQEKDLDVSILLFDHTKVSNKIVKNPEKYGLVELSQECQSTYPEVKPARENPDQYFFWDEWHFSRVAHNIFGEEMYNAVKTFNFKK